MRIGDTVWLKSGGPAMTVVNPHAFGGVECVWHGGQQAFPLEALAIRPPQQRPLTTERNYGDWPPDSVEKLGADL